MSIFCLSSVSIVRIAVFPMKPIKRWNFDLRLRNTCQVVPQSWEWVQQYIANLNLENVRLKSSSRTSGDMLVASNQFGNKEFVVGTAEKNPEMILICYHFSLEVLLMHNFYTCYSIQIWTGDVWGQLPAIT